MIAFSTRVVPALFDASHEALAASLGGGLLAPLLVEPRDHDGARVASILGEIGLYRHLVPGPSARIDARALVLVREALGQVSPLADAIFAVQGLGTYPIVIAGSEEQRRERLPDLVAGRKIAAFGLTEPEAGSDVGSIRTTAVRDGDGWILDGEKTLISNVPIAHQHVVFANADPSRGKKGITAFLVDRGAPGLSVEPIAMSIPHPIGKLRFERCRVSDAQRLGEVGAGLRVALATLDTFRISVGAAANGMAARAMHLAVRHVQNRVQFGAPLAEQQIVKSYLAEMATDLDAARLLVARAAQMKDAGSDRVPVEAAMAKMFATEAAQRIIDRAVQLHGGMGVVEGSEVERLYREIRPLRIYEGTTEIQKLIIAKGILDHAGGMA